MIGRQSESHPRHLGNPQSDSFKCRHALEPRLAPDLNGPFNNYPVVQVAAAAQGGFVNALIEGNVVGAAYAGPRRGR